MPEGEAEVDGGAPSLRQSGEDLQRGDLEG